ncbi:bifunctional 5,10-methylenetetrahydrofolate dehydrogenase/5,10-methenyltetrahydrofolate cyclohydrolase [Culicoidibacter larvae]|uniref:Bifunctional protein FolD n=1 Tax=Culicoidibacter larvae TaxID=2579976 RepID=A0A5R8QDX5_9FIRM|nr:tetrahydrofolate dehydrogenase/cyclohydrolase catalytic domain-containing protein [Culicoidibacter larvae]TLG74203.1 bifunctional 5,10-methylene-tetrahydrofolate dehydrogenase/5,10-methylene-tetrahydrofolate cyclohydrolase [Culicoidibacter larvae]
MSAEIIDGFMIAKGYRERLALEVEKFVAEHGVRPVIRVLLVGDNPASLSYIKGKVKAAAEIGIDSEVLRYEPSITEAELLAEIERINQNPAIHGILVQLPLPKHIDEHKVGLAVDPMKDIDGFHPVNQGNSLAGNWCLESCTPKGVIALLDTIGCDLNGKKVVVIGRSNIVGKPVSVLALNRNATVTICHSRTQNLAEEARQADVLIVAIGQPKFVGADFVKPGAVVIDVGISRTAENKLVGDVDFDSVKEVAGWITPVPRGVGPMTIAMLMQNAFEAMTKQISEGAVSV